MEEQIPVCMKPHHASPPPLIGTMAFRGAEWWCAKCGALYGQFGVNTVPKTKELVTERDALSLVSANFRKASALRTATQVNIDGTWIRPQDIDHETRNRLEAERQAYVFSDPIPV